MANGRTDQLKTLVDVAKSGAPLERADAIAELKRLVKLNAKVAQMIGRTAQHVEQMLLLASAPVEVREDLAKGTLTPTLAVRLLRSARRGGLPVVEAVQTAREQAKARGHEKVAPSDLRLAVRGRSKTSLQHVYRKLRMHLQTRNAVMTLELSRSEVEELYRVLEALR